MTVSFSKKISIDALTIIIDGNCAAMEPTIRGEPNRAEVEPKSRVELKFFRILSATFGVFPAAFKTS